MQIGFVLVTYNKPAMISRLVGTLNRMFDHPPIAVHHDYDKGPCPELSGNVSMVHPHRVTRWGSMTVIDATMDALALLYKDAAPDWVIPLSAADYPIQPAARIIADLTASEADVHIKHERIIYKQYSRPWLKLCHKRYCTARFKLFGKLRSVGHPRVAGIFLPWHRGFRCWAGEHWFCCNRRAAQYLLEYHERGSVLADHYRHEEPYTIVPEESYYQSVFANNAEGLKLNQQNYRYTDWSRNGTKSPKTLTTADLPQILASPCHFARKFDTDVDAGVLDALDARIGA